MRGFETTNEKQQFSVAFVAQTLGRVPVTLTLGLAVLLIAAVPSLGDWLQLDRAAIASGEVWRLATCHLTHWNTEHLLFDWLMFLALGSVCELRSPRQMRVCAAISAVAVTAVVWHYFPAIESYRGLSGVDTGLFVLLGVQLVRDGRHEKNAVLGIVACGLLLGFAAKTALEAATAQTVFVDHDTAGFAPLVWDHIAAGAVGAACAALLNVKRSDRTRRPPELRPHTFPRRTAPTEHGGCACPNVPRLRTAP